MRTRIYLSKDRTRNFVLFYRASSVFSNFHPAEFIASPMEQLLKNTKIKSRQLQFSCSEQYFMYHKAIFVGDEDIADRILTESDPKEMKMLGRMLEMSEEQFEKWTEISRDVMFHACLEKFSQNEKCRKFLFRTHGMNLAEASPTDKIWGIGLDSADKRCEDPKLWRGKNWLGEVLDRVREELWDKKEYKKERDQIEQESLEVRCKKLENC
ncbi:unnamed protein product [Caenorhabditis brenneri]